MPDTSRDPRRPRRRCCCCAASRSSRPRRPRTSSGSPRPPSSTSIAAGEALVREGDVGDELVVIVEGSVRVVHREPDGTERLIRRLRARATTSASWPSCARRPARRRSSPRADGVRGLVIGGDGLKAILRERPGRGDGDARDPRRAARHPGMTVRGRRPPRGPTCRPGRSPSCGPTSRARWASPARSGPPGTRSTQQHLGADRRGGRRARRHGRPDRGRRASSPSFRRPSPRSRRPSTPSAPSQPRPGRPASRSASGWACTPARRIARRRRLRRLRRQPRGPGRRGRARRPGRPVRDDGGARRRRAARRARTLRDLGRHVLRMCREPSA